MGYEGKNSENYRKSRMLGENKCTQNFDQNNVRKNKIYS
jgi:hypothetical protein